MASKDNNGFIFKKENYQWTLIGLFLVVIGFLLMVGGSSDDPNVFDEDALFSFRRITLAPILVLGGYALVVYAIMKKPGKKGPLDFILNRIGKKSNKEA